ncbi:PTS fructose transporter subunit IIB [Enterococcus casseliflavus]|uniref:PTS fructose transporter subunit IIB n=1 Tax=Enterococcus innesii TaxID=2839759 RepID=UPI0009BCFE6E|nr:PTS fructose transporter subunit IIB [Enterococcus innesii]MCO5497141.1 fructose PTS transporter subunit IIB [Enterococcus innesii]OQO85125.1 PTS fructose transporter subunit IIB [Enterococcus casseliflavus]
MKIVGITACTAGIAHTYIAKEKIENAARKNGDEIKIETQGSIGVENELTEKDIFEADIVLIAADISISKGRFKGKKVVDIPISLIMKSADGVIKKIHEKMGN